MDKLADEVVSVLMALDKLLLSRCLLVHRLD
jgi:hypothetical protein